MIVAEPVALLGQMAALAPARVLDPRFAEDVLLTSYGHVAALRLGAAIGLWALAGALRDSPSPRVQWAIPAAGVAVAFVYADSRTASSGLPAGPFTSSSRRATSPAFAAWLGCIAVALAESRGSRLARPAVLAALALVLNGQRARSRPPRARRPTCSRRPTARRSAVKLALVAVAFALGAAARRRAELAAALAVLAAASAARLARPAALA